MRFAFSLACSLSVLLGVVTMPALSQPSGAVGENFIYMVEPGDTLSELSDLYTTRSSQWRHLQNLNNVADPTKLPIGKQLRIPFSLIPVVAVEATLIHFKGEVWINDKAAHKNYVLQTGDVIRTGSNGFATLRLEDQSTLTLPHESTLRIKQLDAFERARLSDAIIELEQGSIESRVAPNKTGVGRFEIHTPLSITGVRGTNLRVHSTQQQTRTELLTGQAHLNTAQANYQNLTKGHGAHIRADGSQSIVPLLPAPVLTEPVRGPKGWETTLQAIPSADHYLVHIALDEMGSEVTHRYMLTANETTAYLRSSGAGQHYAFIRAVDASGLMGLDASVSFPGQQVLVSSSGDPVLSSDGQAILLTDY